MKGCRACSNVSPKIFCADCWNRAPKDLRNAFMHAADKERKLAHFMAIAAWLRDNPLSPQPLTAAQHNAFPGGRWK